MSWDNINNIITEEQDCVTEDIDPSEIQEISIPAGAKCENVVYSYLWNLHYQHKIAYNDFATEEECYTFYSLNSFTHKYVNFVCNQCFDVAKYIWYNTIPNAFSKRHHCHSAYIIFCDKCKNSCSRSPQNSCSYLAFHHKIETENVSANNYVNIPYNDDD